MVKNAIMPAWSGTEGKWRIYLRAETVKRGLVVRFGGAALIVAIVLPHMSFAEPLTISIRSRAALFTSQTSVLDNRAATQYSDSVRLQPPSAVVPGVGGNFSYNGKYNGPYLDVARKMATRHGVPTDLFLRLIQQESGWNPKARSHKGAIGLAQLMPGTAKLLRVNPHDPEQNLEGGARYLRQMRDKFGNWRLALAAYNAGPLAVEKFSGVPPYKETRNYVKKIWGS